jgi:hypothetical protein
MDKLSFSIPMPEGSLVTCLTSHGGHVFIGGPNPGQSVLSPVETGLRPCGYWANWQCFGEYMDGLYWVYHLFHSLTHTAQSPLSTHKEAELSRVVSPG